MPTHDLRSYGEVVGCYETGRSREEMDDAYASKSYSSTRLMTGNTFQAHRTSFQGYKRNNEDRAIFLETSFGMMAAVFDGGHKDYQLNDHAAYPFEGHYDEELSDYASTHLIGSLESRISAVVAQETQNLDKELSLTIIRAIEEFDEALMERTISKMRETDTKPFSEWTVDDVPRFLGMKDLGENDPYPIQRRACVGTTVVIAVVFTKESGQDHDLLIVSLGDSEAYLGRMVNNAWTATILNDFHNTSNPEEVARLRQEHPEEDDVLKNNRTKGQLLVTRALGDALLKVPLDLALILSKMWGTIIWPTVVEQWATQGKHSPPYISSTASVKSFKLKNGDLLILASDGLRAALTQTEVCENAAVPDTIVSLIAAGTGTKELIPRLEKTFGHKCIPTDVAGANVADWAVRNTLFGQDNDKMAREAMGERKRFSDTFRDDISLIVVEIK